MASNRFLSCVNDALLVEFSSQQLSMMSYLVLDIKNTLVFFVSLQLEIGKDNWLKLLYCGASFYGAKPICSGIRVFFTMVCVNFFFS